MSIFITVFFISTRFTFEAYMSPFSYSLLAVVLDVGISRSYPASQIWESLDLPWSFVTRKRSPSRY